MKKAELGDHFFWEGQLTKCESVIDGKKVIGFKVKAQHECPLCRCPIEVDKWLDIIESSPQFQQKAEPIKSITK